MVTPESEEWDRSNLRYWRPCLVVKAIVSLVNGMGIDVLLVPLSSRHNNSLPGPKRRDRFLSVEEALFVFSTLHQTVDVSTLSLALSSIQIGGVLS